MDRVGEDSMALDHVDERLERARKPGFGIGLLKGMLVLLKHLFKRNTVIQYPEVKQDLSPRTRGVIALKEENCTVCMLCARECPDWCIYIDSHKETLPPKRKGGRPRKRNVLDRFAIDYALCMYCGICVEVCPYDALFWSREFEYAEYDIRQLTHEKERLSDWMATVLPPLELEEGAELPGQAKPATATTPAAPAPTQGATAGTPASTSSSAAEARPEQVTEAPKTPTAVPEASKPATTETAAEPAPETAKPTEGLKEATEEQQMDSSATTTPEPAAKIDAGGGVAQEGTQAEVEEATAAETPAGPTSSAVTETPVAQPPAPVKPTPRPEDLEAPEAAYTRVVEAQKEAGSSPQVAEARAKVARVKAERALTQARAATPQQAAADPEPSGAPAAEEPEPAQGPVAPTEQDDPVPAETGDEPQGAAEPAAEPQSAEDEPQPQAAAEDPDAVYERVLAEERAKGSSDPVATSRAKAARMRAVKGTSGPADG
jgi:formate hydrogenlyase subunit 6/NADH:ubiquinone oxidoreductase subunit I